MATAHDGSAAASARGYGFSKRMILLVLLAAYGSLSMIYSSVTVTPNFEPSMSSVVNKQSGHESVFMNDNEDVDRDCLDLGLENEMDQLMSKYKQVFLMMPAKAAGTTLKVFSKACMDSANTPSFQFFDNVANKEEQMMEAFTNQLQMPTLVASHMYKPRYISNLMEHATRDSLLIYVHREETSRLLSSIREVIASRYCFDKSGEHWKKSGVVVLSNNHCQVQETTLIELIRSKSTEIGIGGPRLWTCQTYESIKENRPNLVFMHYKQASKLLKLLSKHHCPSVTNDVKENVGDEKGEVSIILEGPNNRGTAVDLDDWLQAKKQLLEYVLGLKHGVDLENESNISCQGTIREIEDRLFACPSETLQVSGQTHDTRTIRFQF